MSPAAISTACLAEWVFDARARTRELVADLSDAQLMGPRLEMLSPLQWHLGHAAWFQERWVLGAAGIGDSVWQDRAHLYDCCRIPVRERWDLPLPSRAVTLSYLQEVRNRVLALLGRGDVDERLRYHVLYSVFHEDMHGESLVFRRQAHDYPPPVLCCAADASPAGATAGPLPGDAQVPGGMVLLGARRDAPFVFDNEKWAHPVEVRPFAIARAPVTQAEYAAFVEDGGYRRADLWTEQGRRWRETVRLEHPVYWQRADGAWQRRDFGRWVALEPHRPVVHLSRHEAEAYCRWAGRRLPTEVEWEVAASCGPAADGAGLDPHRGCYPWGDDPPTPAHANLDGRAGGCVDVAAHAAGDSAFGCRQMLGNIWEWTSSDFAPYPGFAPDPFREYSDPWFGSHKVLRGGCWISRGRLLRNTFRNFYIPERWDVCAGFRTCAP